MMQQQQQLQQQQMAQRQHMINQQQGIAQSNINQKMNLINNDSNDIIDNIKLEAKNIMTVVFLCVILNIDQVDNLLKSVSIFISESGALNMQAVFLKALVVGISFYLIKSYLL